MSHAAEFNGFRGFLVGTDLEIRADSMGTTQLGKLTSLEGSFDWGLATAGEGVVSDPAHLDSFDAGDFLVCRGVSKPVTNLGVFWVKGRD